MKTTKFKPSEVGPIPVDWEVKRLGEIGDVVTGSTPPRDDMECWGGNYNWISAKDFKDKYIVDSEEKVTTKGMAFCRLLPSDSVLVTCIASIGLNAIAKNPCATNQQINAVICKACNNEYLYYQIEAAKDRMIELAGQTAVPIINKGDFENLMIPVPPRPEQEKIAEALSDVDALLAAMTKLIEKKRAIKQGAMQQLLTGKKRLAGFTGKWVEKRLGDVVEINPSLESVIPEKFVYVDLESVAGGRLLERKLVLRERAPSRAQRRFVQGDILFQTVRPYQRNNLLVGFDAANYVASTGYAVIRGRALCSCSEFIYHIIHVDDFVNGVLDRCTGTSYPAINPGKLAEIIVRIPEAVAEQRAIASVLSDMDAEIAALEAKRAKYESIKQGMMQELLTGRTRLV